MADTVYRGEIYYVAGTFGTGSEITKNRPAIIVSNDTGNRHAPVVEVVYLTTKTKTPIPTHVNIHSAAFPSTALCEQIFTVCKSRLLRRLGRLTEREMNRVDKALQVSVGLQRAGGDNSMQITMITPFGEMKFDMAATAASEIIQTAFKYAARYEEQGEPAEVAPAPPVVRQEPPELHKTNERPHRRVDSLFGGYSGLMGQASEEKQPEEAREPEEYKGFLLIKCEKCGKIRGFCAKTPTNKHRCECGHITELHDLKRAYLECKCGGRYKYNTNVTDDTFDYPCLNCGSPVDMELNKRRNAYVTIGAKSR